MLRILFKTMLYICIALVLFLLLFIATNWRDEPLKPEVAAVLNWQPPAHMLEDNGYLILLGLDAPLAQDAMQFGKEKYTAELARYEQMQLTHLEPPEVYTAHNTFGTWKGPQCAYAQQNCVDFYLSLNRAILAEIIEQNNALLNRFHRIKHSQYYIEALVPMVTAEISAYESLVSAAELQRVQAVLAIADRQTAQGMAQLIENAQFSRRLLKSANSLISHITALNLLERDIQMISELLAKYPTLAQQYQAQLTPVIESIETPEFSIRQALMYERNMPLPTINHLTYADHNQIFGEPKEGLSLAKSIALYFAKLLYQPDATTNLFYDLGTLRLKLADAPAHQLNQAKESATQARAAYFNDCYTKVMLCFNNPIGKILASVAEPDIANYIERHHDTEGYLRLVRIQLALLAKNTSQDNMAALLAQHPNPYTLKPMAYDKQLGLLRFEGRATQDNEAKKVFTVKVAAIE